MEIQLTAVQYLELEKLALGAFNPLTGFMNEDDYMSVINTMRLPNGAPFPLPVLKDISRGTGAQLAFSQPRCVMRPPVRPPSMR